MQFVNVSLTVRSNVKVETLLHNTLKYHIPCESEQGMKINNYKPEPKICLGVRVKSNKILLKT